MLEISGFADLEMLRRGADAYILRGRRLADDCRVVLKVASAERPSAALAARFAREHQIASTLDLAATVRCLDLGTADGKPYLVFADTGGRRLDRILGEQSLDLGTFLRAATKIATAVADIHQHNIIHKDIKPASIIVRGDFDEVMLSGFGIASRATRESQGVLMEVPLQGSLAYCSPEQTGRMNRGVDYRSDFYSLGATFYEMLCGRTPFELSDPLELIHAQIARIPASPSRRDARIPQVLSDLVMKLLAKDAEDRYQSGQAIVADLQECQNLLRASGHIPEFELARGDISDKFLLSERIYGRDQERANLLGAFDKAADGERILVLVAGAAGVGKTALVNEIGRAIIESSGHLISGKFSQHNRGGPYGALIDAFQGLTHQLLTRSETDLADRRAKLLRALGTNAAVVTDVLPDIELIIGSQPPVKELGRQEAQNRFRLVFQNFVRAFCEPEQPLVIFLDDMQWADQASVLLLESLLRDRDTNHLLVIAAYRDTEVTLADPFPRALGRLAELGIVPTRITLEPLGFESVNALVSDSLSVEPDQSRELSELVNERTLGNPFFVNQFLHHLHDLRAIRFDHHSSTWQWDIAEIGNHNTTDNVAELMTMKLRDLDPECENALRLASCIGSRFDLASLAAVAQTDVSTMAGLLEVAMLEGLISHAGTAAVSQEPEAAAVTFGGLRAQRFRFVHDRVHQAVYDLIPEPQRAGVHLSIGRRLLETTPEDELDTRIFEVIKQLNEGVGEVTDADERGRLARLNAIAARRSLESQAFHSALEHVEIALGLAGENTWDHDYDLALQLHIGGAAAAAMTGDTNSVLSHCNEVFARGRDIHDKLPAYESLINYYYASSQQVAEALRVGHDALAELGLRLPRNPNAAHAAWHLLRTKIAMRGKSIDDLAALPAMTDKRVAAIMRLLVSLDGIAYNANPNTLAVHALAAVRLSLKHGNASSSGWAYNLYGAILCAGLGDIEGGNAISTFGYDLARELDDTWMQSRIVPPYYTTVAHWKMPMQKMQEPLRDGIEQALELGEYNAVGANLMYGQTYRFFSGVELEVIEHEQRESIKQCRAIEQGIGVDFIEVWHAIVVDLRSGDDEGRQELPIAPDPLAHYSNAGNKNGIFVVHFARSLHYYLLGDYDAALHHSDLARREEGAAAGTVLAIEQMFLRALILLACAGHVGKRQRRRHLGEARKRHKKLRAWMPSCPHNFEHKADLIAAEIARLEGRFERAAGLYQRAYDGARDSSFVHESAITAERVCQWQLELGATHAAATWFAEARNAYMMWGADRKVRLLDAAFPDLARGADRGARGYAADGSSILSRALQPMGSGPATLFGATDQSRIDLTTMLRVSEVLAGEMLLERLLARIMRAAIENAGAESGALILNHQGRLRVEAVGRSDAESVEVAQSLPLEDLSTISPGIINYVRRTHESVVLDDAAHRGNFTQDAYIQSNQVRSVVCSPLLNQGELEAILYLENNLTAGAFTPERVDLMTLLCAQASISLKNARLYAQQVELTNAYSRFVPRQFLSMLGRKSIVGVQLGDQIETDMAILFMDIRAFTALSETMSPQENFALLNEFLGRMSPIIRHNTGFIDKYTGDGFMALFPGGADDAVKTSVEMHAALEVFNDERSARGEPRIDIGVGVHIGRLMLGTVGEPERMEGTVISDAVNLASRLEGLTKTYGALVLLSEEAFLSLSDRAAWSVRYLGHVIVKGKRDTVGIYELLDAETAEGRRRKLASKDRLAEALVDVRSLRWPDAERRLREIVDTDPDDRVAALFLDRVVASQAGARPELQV